MDKVNALNVPDHAREISFAVFRVCALIEQQVLRMALESAAVNLAAASVLDNKKALSFAGELEQLVRLSEVIGEIKLLNSKVLLRELADLKSKVTESSARVEEVNLELMFDYKEKKAESPVEQVSLIKLSEIEESEIVVEVKPKPEEIIKFNKPISLETNQASNRQSAILQYIKALPNGCRMKDLLERFPSVSERTLRNDLQTLISSSSIERFGAIQGPFAYYRVKGKNFPESSSEGFNEPFSHSSGSSSSGVTKDRIIAL